MTETLAERAEIVAAKLNDETNGGNLLRWCDPRVANRAAATLRELAAANDALAAEVAALREALEQIGACTSEHGGAGRALKIIRAALAWQETKP